MVETAVGRFEFETCNVAFTLYVDGSGGTVAHITDIGGDSPCNDVKPCFTDDAILPWRGQLRASSSSDLSHEFYACLDTCMGRFRGNFSMSLREGAKGWRGAADTALGTSGWGVEGRWKLRMNGIEIRTS